jgi:GTP-binding protein
MPLVALVGRPNVGKSALFNRLTGTGRALVEDQPGVTRDRLYQDTDWNGRTFTLVDTGGLWEAAADHIMAYIRRQTEQAMAEADVLCLVVDAQAGVTAADRMVAELIRRSGKPVLVAANKAEGRVDLSEFYSLGLGDPIPVSASHGEGTGDLLDAMVETLGSLPAAEFAVDAPAPPIRVALVGRPNVGKSSLLNLLVGQERSLVTPIAGTTRDVVDARLVVGGREFLLLDTAGLRRPNRVEAALERRTVQRTLRAAQEADVVLMMVAADEPLTRQDLRIAGHIRRYERAVVLLANKADRVRGTTRPVLAEMAEAMDFLSFARRLAISATTGWHVDEIWPAVEVAFTHFTQRIPTRAFNAFLREAVTVTPPPTHGTRQLRIYYGTQVGVRPPHFVLFVNDPDLMHFSYVRYLENTLRERWDFSGTPVRFTLRRHTRPAPRATLPAAKA